MNETLLDELLESHKKEVEKINRQRRLWMYASSIVFTSIIFLIFGWEWLSGLESRGVWWLIVSLMLLISVNWWYWTMKVVKLILYYQEIEYKLIKQIHNDIGIVKNDLQNSFKEIVSGL